jgi:hypothetical protein
MKWIIFTFSAICLLSFSLFAQTEQANKIGEIEDTSDGDIKNTVHNIRDNELAKNFKSKLYIINYGTPQLVTKRMKQLNKAFDFTPVDRTRIEIAPPIPYPFLMTEFWIVPEGAENPKPTIYAEKFTSFKTANNSFVSITIQKFVKKVNETSIGYIVNFGTKNQKAARIKQLNKAFNFIGIETYRIVIVDGGSAKTVKTELWIVPPKSEK